MAIDVAAHNNAQMTNLANFLKYARLKPDIVQLGSITTATSGGSTASNVTFTPSDISEVPAWCTDILVQVQLTITVTVPANTTANVSPLFPYNCMQHQLLLAGAPTFPLSSGVPWFLDDITSRRKYDPNDGGVGLYSGGQEDQGPTPWTLTNATPGGTIANATSVSANTTVTVKYQYRLRLQRNRSVLWGCFPVGDPENRPRFVAQMSALVGTDPADSPFQDPAGGGVTAVLADAGVCNVIYLSRSLDLTPPGVNLPLPQPIVGFGLQLDADTPANAWTAGAIGSIPLRTAMLYEKVFNVVESVQALVRPDYWAFWTTGDQQSARWAWDSAVGNQQAYYQNQHHIYGRYLPKGVMVADFVSGEFPELPSVSPYDGLVSPDVNYAAAAGTAPIPAMHTALRYPTGTTMTTPKVRTYSFGRVEVPY